MNSRSRYYYRVKKKCFALFGNACIECGNDDPVVLQLDHKYRTQGGEPIAGKKRNLLETWLYLVRGKISTSEFQLLCANCHARKTRLDWTKVDIEEPPIKADTATSEKLATGAMKHQAWVEKKAKEQPPLPGVDDIAEQRDLGEMNG